MVNALIGRSTHSGATSEVEDDVHPDALIQQVSWRSVCRACREQDVDNLDERTSSSYVSAGIILVPITCLLLSDPVRSVKEAVSAYRSHGYGKLNARSRGSRERALQQERVLVFTAEPAWEYDTAGTAGARHLVNAHIDVLSADSGNDCDIIKHLYDSALLYLHYNLSSPFWPIKVSE